MTSLNIVCLLLLVIIDVLVVCKQSELLAITVLYRHGHRTPRRLYTNDPYQNKISELWPEGFGQLTNTGKNASFELGKWYKRKYKKFIPKIYNKNFITVLSSDKDRCLMTAACVLAGLFPPKDEQIWNDNINWQPIPIHTIPSHLDGLLIVDDRFCEKSEKLYEKMIQSINFQQFLNSKKDILEYISIHSGENENLTIHDAINIHDVFFIESYYNLTIPHWSKKVYPHDTYPLLTIMSAVETNTTELARLKSGLLVDYITTFFEDYLRDPDTSQKMLMLSGHDSTIARLMNVLGVYDYTWAEYASTLVFELRRKKKQVFIKIYFKDSKNLRKIKLPQCPMECNFEAFKNITKPIRINDDEWVKECASE